MPRKVVLLVEDNADDRDLTLRAFERNRLDVSVDVAADGEEALAYLLGRDRDGPPRPLPAVVLLDLNLPGVDGLEVLRRMRAAERTRRLPVVVLTSSGEDRDLVQSYDLGANSYVRKPVSFTDFMEASRQLGVYWLVLNEAPPEVARG
jgi:two-component system response regulator